MKGELLPELRASEAGFVAALAAIPYDRWPSRSEGEWGVREIVGHVAAWNQEARDRIMALMAGAASREYDVDAFNAAAVAHRRQWSTESIEEEFHRASSQLFELLESLPDEAFANDGPARGWTVGLSEHLRLHTSGLANGNRPNG